MSNVQLLLQMDNWSVVAYVKKIGDPLTNIILSGLQSMVLVSPEEHPPVSRAPFGQAKFLGRFPRSPVRWRHQPQVDVTHKEVFYQIEQVLGPSRMGLVTTTTCQLISRSICSKDGYFTPRLMKLDGFTFLDIYVPTIRGKISLLLVRWWGICWFC